MLDDNMQSAMVTSDSAQGAAQPTPVASVRLPSKRHRWWAVPLAIVGIAEIGRAHV